VFHRPILLLESRQILSHLQQFHADFIVRNSLSHLTVDRDGTFTLSSRNRGWKIWYVVRDTSLAMVISI
jgi:hypothetical protein